MTITDEMVEKARVAAQIHSVDYHIFRAALEAVAPMLIAQGLREAAKIASDNFDLPTWQESIAAILDRAREIDPQ